MRKRERYGVIYWRMWVGLMLIYAGVIFATDYSDHWPLRWSLVFGFGVGLVLDAVARVADRVHRYARVDNDR